MILTVTIGGTTETPLYEGSSYTLDAQGVGSARLILREDGETFTPAHRDTVVVKEGATARWTGYIRSIRRQQNTHVSQIDFILLCVDYKALLQEKRITKIYDGQSDEAIIKDVLDVTDLDLTITVNDADLDTIDADMGIVSFNNQTVEQAFLDITNRTKGVITIDGAGAIHYNTIANAGNASYDLSDEPNNSTTFPFGRAALDSRFDEPYNDIKVIGGFDTTGSRIVATAEDSTSITTYNGKPSGFDGRLKLTVRDENIVTSARAQEIANALRDKHANPIETLTCTVWEDGLAPNERIDVTSKQLGLSADEFLINALTAKQLDNSTTEYTLRLGENFAHQEAILRQLNAVSQQLATPRMIHCLDFDGTDDFFTDADNDLDNLMDGADGMSVLLWVFPDSFSATQNTMIEKDDGWRFEIINSGAGLRFLEDEIWDATTLGVTAGQWNGILVTHELNGPTRFRVNNTEVLDSAGTADAEFSNDDSANPLRVGSRADGSDDFNGRMAFVAIWNIALSAGDRARVTREPNYDAILNTRRVNMLRLWKLDDAAVGASLSGADTVLDAISTTGHGSPTGNPTGAEEVYTDPS